MGRGPQRMVFWSLLVTLFDAPARIRGSLASMRLVVCPQFHVAHSRRESQEGKHNCAEEAKDHDLEMRGAARGIHRVAHCTRACPASGLWPDGGVAHSLDEAKAAFRATWGAHG